MAEGTPDEPGVSTGGGPGAPLRCDFCGEPAGSLRRVVLDGDYERLRTPHRELYACPPCSDRKERTRLGLG